MKTLSRPLRRHLALERLLHPASIAVIGASPRAGAFGAAVLRNLGRYEGRIYPINARYQHIGELVCYPSVGAVPEKVDCALLATAREAVEPIVHECVAAGVGGAIVFASGYAETGRAERVAEQSRLAAIARESGMALLGQTRSAWSMHWSVPQSPLWISRRCRRRRHGRSASSANRVRWAWRWRRR
jgi:acyl-CoA synthetase (NDP forming)